MPDASHRDSCGLPNRRVGTCPLVHIQPTGSLAGRLANGSACRFGAGGLRCVADFAIVASFMPWPLLIIVADPQPVLPGHFGSIREANILPSRLIVRTPDHIEGNEVHEARAAEHPDLPRPA